MKAFNETHPSFQHKFHNICDVQGITSDERDFLKHLYGQKITYNDSWHNKLVEILQERIPEWINEDDWDWLYSFPTVLNEEVN